MRKKRGLGKAFPDTIIKTTIKSGHFKKDLSYEDISQSFIPNLKEQNQKESISLWRMTGLMVIFLVGFFILFFRLFHLQVVMGPYHKILADTNRVQSRTIHAPRGVIYDRNGKILAENNPGFRLEGRFISRDESLKLEVSHDPKFTSLEIDTIRSYPQGLAFSHVLGYVGEVSLEELDDLKYANYKLGDRVGRTGVEQIYESYLKGVDGSEIIEIDANGKKIRTLKFKPPIPGNNIHLSIDAALQESTYEQLKSQIEKLGVCCGAAVAEKPKTGEVLFLVSIPSYDGNAFNDPLRQAEIDELFSDKKTPLLNRVIAGTYPPGSTFKIATSLAALSSGKFTKDTQIEDTGVLSLGPYTFANWYFTKYGKKEGMIDIIKALQRSNDIYFYHIGEKIGEKAIGEVARKIGFGKRLGIDLPGEEDGLIPDETWKLKKFGQVWFPGDTLHMAIGQGFILATPLQILAATSFIASDGKLMQPHLISKVTRHDGSVMKKFQFDPVVQNLFPIDHIQTIQDGLEAVTRQGGTAWPFFTYELPTAGKTGSSEYGDTRGRTHAWYTAYAPLDNPEIAAVVLIEGGGEGSSVAAPIVKQIFNWYFNPEREK